MTDTTQEARTARRSRHEAILAEVAPEEAEAAEAEIAEKVGTLDMPLHLRIDRELLAPRPTTGQSGRWGWTPRWSAPISTLPAPATRHRPTSPRRTSQAPRLTQGAGSNDKKSSDSTDREALGRSRGGLTTKIHLAADARARPISADHHSRAAS